jgi:hypothetical protein
VIGLRLSNRSSVSLCVIRFGESHILPQDCGTFATTRIREKRDGLVRDTNVNALPIAQRWISFPMWTCSALVVLTFCLVTVDATWSQPPSPKGKAKQAPVPTKGSPPAMIIDPETLPPDFVPPKTKSSELDLIKPLALPDEMDKLKKDEPKFQQALNRAVWDDAAKTVIRNVIRHRLSQMCQEKNLQREALPELYKLRVDLIRALNGAGSTAKELKPDVVKKFRQDVMLEFIKQATPLLDNNLYVRQQIVIMLGELELVQENTQKSIAAEAFTPAFEPLVIPSNLSR